MTALHGAGITLSITKSFPDQCLYASDYQLAIYYYKTLYCIKEPAKNFCRLFTIAYYTKDIDYNHATISHQQRAVTTYAYNLTAVPEAITISMLPLPPIVSKSRSTPMIALAPMACAFSASSLSASSLACSITFS